MEVFEPISRNLRSHKKEPIPPVIRNQLNYLWKAAHAVITSPNLSVYLSRKFVQLGNKYGLNFPDFVKDKLCNYCTSLVLPSITTRIRIRHRGKNSKCKVAVPSVTCHNDASILSSSSKYQAVINQVVRIVLTKNTSSII